MSLKNSLVSKITVLGLANGCTDEAPQGRQFSQVDGAMTADGNSKIDTQNAPSETTSTKRQTESSDPCLAFINDPVIKDFYLDWRARLEEVTNEIRPVPQALRDPAAQTCQISRPEAGIEGIMTRDGQIILAKTNPTKPDMSFRLALSTNGNNQKNTTEAFLPKPFQDDIDKYQSTDAPLCEQLLLDTWKQWQLKMPDNPMVSELRNDGLVVPCDTTAKAGFFLGGCSYNDETGDSGCAGGADKVGREDAEKLIKCVAEAVQAKGKEICF